MKVLLAIGGLALLALAVWRFEPHKLGIAETLAMLPDHDPSSVVPNVEWTNQEPIEIRGYEDDAMEVGISPDGQFLLFNDRNKPNKDMHWSVRIGARTYDYKGKVKNTITSKVDGTPSFDGDGTLYFITMGEFPRDIRSLHRARFENGEAKDITELEGDIYRESPNLPVNMWISLDPDVSDDGTLLVYSEGRFSPMRPFPYPFKVRGAELRDGRWVRMDERILANVNTASLEYAPAISADGLELFFTRISKVDGRPKFVGIYVAKRRSRSEPFGSPERIMAITGDVEAPVLSGNEQHLYYHRMVDGVFKVFRVRRKGA